MTVCKSLRRRRHSQTETRHVKKPPGSQPGGCFIPYRAIGTESCHVCLKTMKLWTGTQVFTFELIRQAEPDGG
jgi:hypothetical protein